MPLPDVHVRIVDGDEGVRELGTGEVGEIIIAAPQLMLGYWNRPDETAEMLRDRPGEMAPPAGCTPATLATSTRTATCSSSIGKRT